ncbi:MAG: HDOD domain-containing protein, partial [Magnetococcales bacterium]|nr:HDOD domain-containing protein [Magnetococcales bacterium]
ITIPSRPSIMLEVAKATRGFAPDLQGVAEIIRRDMLLSSEVLGEANRKLSDYKGKVGSIQQAVMLLGLPRVREIVTRQFLTTSLIGRNDPMQKVRMHSLSVAQAAARLAYLLPDRSPTMQNGYLPTIHPDEAYTVGLLHDVGVIILMQCFDNYRPFHEEMRTHGGRALVNAENDRFNTDHCQVGALLADRWNLPETVWRVILSHHDHDAFFKAGKKVQRRKAAVLQGILHLAEHAAEDVFRDEWDLFVNRFGPFFDLNENALQSLRNEAGAALTPPSDTN